jgi:hypothetical protein
MVIARSPVPALANDFPFPDDYASDTRIGIGRVTAALSQSEGSRHVTVISRVEHDASIPITQQGHLLAAVRSGLLEALHLMAEFNNILKSSVDRSEADIRNLVEFPQFIHNQVAHKARRHFPLARGAQPVNDPCQRRLDLLGTDGSLLQCAGNP